jgi:flagellar basal-body rod protein FlgF
LTPESLRAAASALRYWELRQQVASNNLANVETPGFKGERVFAQLLNDSLSAGARTDFRAGALRPTNGPLDLAIEGDGFLVVDTPGGERLLRGGALRLDAQSRIADAAGNPLLGEEGAIIVPAGAQISIDADGTVRADGKVLDRLRVETVAAPDELEHEQGGLFRATGARTSVEVAQRTVRQGFLEDSNVNTLESMIELITIQRSYAAVQGSLRTLDGVMDTIANQIGRVG